MYAEDRLRKLQSLSKNGNVFVVCEKRNQPKEKRPTLGHFNAKGVDIDIAIQKAKQGHVLAYYPSRLGLILLDDDSRTGEKNENWNAAGVYKSFSKNGGYHYIFHLNKESLRLYRNYRSKEGPERGEVIGRDAGREYAVLPFPDLIENSLDIIIQAAQKSGHFIPLSTIEPNFAVTKEGVSLKKAYSLANEKQYPEALQLALETLEKAIESSRTDNLYATGVLAGRLAEFLTEEEKIFDFLGALYKPAYKACTKNGYLDTYDDFEFNRNLVNGFEFGSYLGWDPHYYKKSNPKITAKFPLPKPQNATENTDYLTEKEAEKENKSQNKSKNNEKQNKSHYSTLDKPEKVHIYQPHDLNIGKGTWHYFKKGWKSDPEAHYLVKAFKDLNPGKIESKSAEENLIYMARHDFFLEGGWKDYPDGVGLPEGKYLDFRDLSIRDQEPEEHIIRTINVVPIFEKKSTLFHNTLDDLISQELKELLLKAMAYTLTGYTDAHKAFFCFGPTASGKSTVQSIITKLLGSYANVIPENTILSKRSAQGRNIHLRNWQSDLANGCRVGIMEEVDEFQRLEEGIFKKLVTTDEITADRKFEGFKTYKSKAKLWLFGNSLPAMSGDEALKRRIIHIPFEHSLPEKKRNPRVKEVLTSPVELAKIFGELLQILSPLLVEHQKSQDDPQVIRNFKWFPDSEDLPEESQQVEREAIRDLDPLVYYIRSKLKYSENPEGLESAIITKKFRHWYSSNEDLPPITKFFNGDLSKSVPNRLGREMKKHGYPKYNRSKKTELNTMGQSVVWYRNVSWRES